MNAHDILAAKGNAVITTHAGASLDDAIATLAQKNIGALVVVDGDGRIEGILSERDIIRVLDGAPVGFRATPVSEVMTKSVTSLTDAATSMNCSPP